MINRILPLLNKLVPAGLAFKGLQKLDPRIGRFLKIAGASYGLEGALDFLRDKFETPGAKSNEKYLQSNLGTGNLRPDQEASLQQIENSKQLPRLLGQAASGATALAGGAGLAGLASQALESGLNENPQQQQQEQNQVSGPSNPLEFISQYSPQLSQSLEKLLSNGQPPEAAAAILKTSSSFQNFIKKIEKDTGKDFIDLIFELFGGKPQQEQGNQRQSQQSQQAQQSQGIDPQLAQLMQGIRSSIQNIRGR